LLLAAVQPGRDMWPGDCFRKSHISESIHASALVTCCSAASSISRSVSGWASTLPARKGGNIIHKPCVHNVSHGGGVVRHPVHQRGAFFSLCCAERFFTTCVDFLGFPSFHVSHPRILIPHPDFTTIRSSAALAPSLHIKKCSFALFPTLVLCW